MAWQRKSVAWGPSEQSLSPHQETRRCNRARNPSFTEDAQKPLVPTTRAGVSSAERSPLRAEKAVPLLQAVIFRFN